LQFAQAQQVEEFYQTAAWQTLKFVKVGGSLDGRSRAPPIFKAAKDMSLTDF
jgi:hypothetical protein